MEAGDPGVYASADEAVSKVEEGMALLGFDVAKLLKGWRLRIVDLQPIIAEKVGEKSQIGIKGWLRGPSRKEPLQGVSRAVEDSVIGLAKPALVLDSLTTLLLRSSEEDVLHLVQGLLARLRLVDAFSIFSITSGNYSERFGNVLRSFFDGVLELKLDESSGGLKRLLRVFSLKGAHHSLDWVRFSVSDRGMVVEEPLKARCSWCSRPIGAVPVTYEISGELLYFDTKDCLITYRKLKSVHGDIFR